MIGSVCFRLRGPYFVLASIAVTEIMRLTAINWKSLTNGAEGILAADIPTVHLGNIAISAVSKVPFYYAGLILALLTVMAGVLVRHSKLGYYFRAIREDQDAANSLGINLAIYKNAALVLSAIFTSLAGSFSAVYIGFIDPGTVLSLDLSVQIVLICIIGGIGTIWGPVIGSLVLVPLSEMLRSNYLTQVLIQMGLVGDQTATGLFLKEHLGHAHLLIYGVMVVVVILFMPEGVLGYLKQLFRQKKAEVA